MKMALGNEALADEPERMYQEQCAEIRNSEALMEISIDKITDEACFPGWVECSLRDAFNNKHRFIEKIPIVSHSGINEKNSFPQRGVIRCQVKRKWVDENGKKMLTVGTWNPDGVETVDGVSEFDLLESQLEFKDEKRP